MSEKQLWSGRFAEGPNQMTLAFSSSLSADMKLAWYDIIGSVAHAKMLTVQKIVPEKDGEMIVDGLLRLLNEVEKGELDLSDDLEDIHTNVEFLLTERIGDAGKRLHTARSRNDQVATDLRMFVRDATLETIVLLIDVQDSLIEQAKGSIDVVCPGFTHMQHAQPVSLGFHLLAHVFKLQRDVERLLDSYKRVNQCPLGAGALAGTTYPIDRGSTAEMLGFDRPTDNAMDSVSDRDFALEYAFNGAMIAAHLSSMCEELVIWSSPEFSFVEMNDAFATGSSIMPQKKNPDVAELIRGRSSIAFGNLMQALTMVKGLPLAYNRDLQEDKAPVFSTYETITSCLYMLGPMYSSLRFRPDVMKDKASKGFLNATDLADYLVLKGVPFRDSHAIVGKAVRDCLEKGKALEDLSLKELRSYSSKIDKDITHYLTLESCMQRRTSSGGTSPVQVEVQIQQASRIAESHKEFCHAEIARLDKVWESLRE